MAFDVYSSIFPTLQEAMAMRGNRKSGGRMAPDWRNPKFTGWRPYIPEEIVKDILSRVPIKSLLRFKCVNKLWNSIISDPDFALLNDHRARAVFFTSHPQYICFYFIDSEAVVQKYLWRRKANRFKDEDEDDDDDEDEDAYEDEDDFVDSEAFIRWDPWRKKETFTQIYPWKRKEAFIQRHWMRNRDQSDDDDYFVDGETFIQRYPWWRMASLFEGDEDEDWYNGYFDFRSFAAGSCNGLLLLVFGKSFFLWNPSTRYMRKVLELSRLLDKGYRVTYGLCFDSFTDDYKVVVGLAHLSPDYGGEFVIVASLKEKQWRTVKFPHQFSIMESGPVVNGLLHWKVNKRDKRYRYNYNSFCTPHRIVAFDPKTNEFKEFPMPKPKNRDGNVVLGLGVLGGCLCMAHWDKESSFEGNVEVLVMKEYGVKESWTTIFEITNLNIGSPFYTSLRPLLLMRNGEILLMMERKILIYNPRKMTYRSVQLKKWYGYGDLFDSLASPTVSEWDEEQHGSLGKQIIWLSDSEDTADSNAEDTEGWDSKDF